jgi:hypothetical protein
MRANNGIDRAGIAAMCTSDTPRFVDDGHRRHDRLLEWNNVTAEKIGQFVDCFLSTRWAEVNSSSSVDNSSCEGPAAGESTLRALCLWKKFIDLLDKIAVAGRQSAGRKTEANSGN